MFFVIAPRRSGSNFLERLLLDNLNYDVANLNRKDRPEPEERRPHVHDQYGNKHDISPAQVAKMLEDDGKVVALSRNPQDWIIAQSRYYKRYNPDASEEAITNNQEKWVKNSYNRFWRVIFSQVERGRDIYILRYEDLLVQPEKTIEAIASHFNLRSELSSKIVILDREVHPNGGIGVKFERPADPFSCYDPVEHESYLEKARGFFDTEILKKLRYELN